MEIGGMDIFFPTTNPNSLEIATRIIHQHWKDAVFENADTTYQYKSFEEISFTMRELFIYQNQAAKDLWEDKGAVTEAINTMIYLIKDADMLTIVIDNLEESIEKIINQIKEGCK